MYDFGNPPKIRCRNSKMLRAQQLGIITFYLVRHAAGSFKSADHLSEGISYFRQICDVEGESRQIMWLL